MKNSLLLALAALLAWPAGAASLQEVRERGQLRVAIYTEFAPFSDQGRGIDVEVAQALARKLGVAAELLPFKDG
jgi:L-cystine transport system substrate-binding protein